VTEFGWLRLGRHFEAPDRLRLSEKQYRDYCSDATARVYRRMPTSRIAAKSKPTTSSRMRGRSCFSRALRSKTWNVPPRSSAPRSLSACKRSCASAPRWQKRGTPRAERKPPPVSVQNAEQNRRPIRDKKSGGDPRPPPLLPPTARDKPTAATINKNVGSGGTEPIPEVCRARRSNCWTLRGSVVGHGARRIDRAPLSGNAPNSWDRSAIDLSGLSRGRGSKEKWKQVSLPPPTPSALGAAYKSRRLGRRAGLGSPLQSR
jgi:hypothetical protein